MNPSKQLKIPVRESRTHVAKAQSSGNQDDVETAYYGKVNKEIHVNKKNASKFSEFWEGGYRESRSGG